MAFPDDPLDPENVAVDRVRLSIGDTDPDALILSNDLYEYFLLSNNDKEGQATISALKHLVAKYAKYIDEETGDVDIKLSQLYKQYKNLLDLYTNDPTFSVIGSPVPYAGGISKSDLEKYECNDDNLFSPIKQGWVSDQFKKFKYRS